MTEPSARKILWDSLTEDEREAQREQWQEEIKIVTDWRTAYVQKGGRFYA